MPPTLAALLPLLAGLAVGLAYLALLHLRDLP